MTIAGTVTEWEFVNPHPQIYFDVKNETGEIATRQDLMQSTPPPAGTVNHLEQSDVRIEMHGDTAVTSFTDNLTQRTNGSVRTASFLSTEVWQKNGDRWLLISSQTMTKPKEPAAATLKPEELDDYVGTYTANGATVQIARKDAALVPEKRSGRAFRELFQFVRENERPADV